MSDTSTSRLFAHRAFVAYWFARISSASAYQMLTVAVAWQVYDLTRSAFALGLVGLVQFLPKLVLMPVAGELADRFERRRVVAGAQALQFVTLLVLALGTGFDFCRCRSSMCCWPRTVSGAPSRCPRCRPCCRRWFRMRCWLRPWR